VFPELGPWHNDEKDTDLEAEKNKRDGKKAIH